MPIDYEKLIVTLQQRIAELEAEVERLPPFQHAVDIFNDGIGRRFKEKGNPRKLLTPKIGCPIHKPNKALPYF